MAQVERLEDGRMNILTEGEARFRIVQFREEAPFWRAIVELVDDRREPESLLEKLRKEVGQLYIEAYRKGVELTGERPAELELPIQLPTCLSWCLMSSIWATMRNSSCWK